MHKTVIGSGTGFKNIAVLLCNTYEFERRRHDGQRTPGAYSPHHFSAAFGDIGGRRRRRVGPDNIEERKTTSDSGPVADLWLKIADLVTSRRFDPEAFIRCQFLTLSPASHSPSIQYLLSQQAVFNYENSRRDFHRVLLTALASNNSLFKTQMAIRADGQTSEQASEDVLDDDEVELSALFRYCMACGIAAQERTQDKPAFLRLAAYYRQNAAMQYVIDVQVYDAAWRSFIPPGFRHEAETIYRDTVGYPQTELK